jgi:ketosteroid isomerase-like protein
MTARTVENELMGLEKQYWQAIKNKDVDAAIRLTDDPCIVAGAEGVAAINRKAFSGMLNSGAWTLNEFELGDDMQVRLISDDVGLVAYRVKEELTVEGKPVTLEAVDTSTWVRRDGGWVCALHSESIVGDPYGRDRQPMK